MGRGPDAEDVEEVHARALDRLEEDHARALDRAQRELRGETVMATQYDEDADTLRGELQE